MKGLFYSSIFIVSLGLLFACSDNFLDETETTDLEKETVFADSTYTSQFLNELYADIAIDIMYNRWTGGLQTASDEAAYKSGQGQSTDVLFATGAVTPMTCTDDVWSVGYENIRRANVFFQNADSCRMDESAMKLFKAEARFLRAWYYAMLLRHYGGVPIVYDQVFESVEEAQLARNTYSECVEYICSEALAAADSLPSTRSGNYFGRATSGACKALVSRVRLYAASPLYNGSDFATDITYDKELVGYTDYDASRWKDAADAALDVIETNIYSLPSRHQDQDGNDYPGWGWYAQFIASDYYNDIDDVDLYSGTIFEKKYESGIGIQGAFDPPSCNGSGTGGYIYHDLVELFPMKDGTPTSESADYDPCYPADNRDPRFAYSVTYDGCIRCTGTNTDINYGTEIYCSVGTGQDCVYRGTPTGYYVRKFQTFIAHYYIAYGACPQSRALIRFTEILLNYAEATNEYYGPDHVDDYGEGLELSPIGVLKALREFAGIDAGDDGMYGLKEDMTQDEMREAIRLERRIDLAFEGHRFFDVRRWMIAEDTDNATMHGLEITRVDDETKTCVVFDARTHVFRKAMYLFPIPYNETVKSEELVQNPYYE